MIQRGNWKAWVSWRFLTGRKGGRGRIVFMFSILLIGAGVATLNTVLAVMNGLQQGFISSIMEIGSYHLQWNQSSGSKLDRLPLQKLSAAEENALRTLESDAGVRLATPFREDQTLIKGAASSFYGVLVRGVSENFYQMDEGLRAQLNMVEGTFDLSGSRIVLGAGLASQLGVSVGDTVTVIDFSGASGNARVVPLTVSGIFRCGYRDYEDGFSFVSIDTAAYAFGSRPLSVGVKLKNPEADRQVMARLDSVMKETGGHVTSWRENNRSFFGALRTEKVMMILILALIFVVVSVNIDHSLRRMVSERMEDLAIIKAVGGSPGSIRVLFLRHGFIIGIVGGIGGSILGVLTGMNVEKIVNFFRDISYRLNPFGGGLSVRTLSVEAFFAHSQVMISDVLLVLSVSFFLCSLSALRASGMAARAKPAEVLRSE